MWFLSLFLMHAPHCHYCPLLGGDRDGAEGVDGCWCRAGCHYSIYWARCARHLPQNGRGAPTWLRLWGINDSHLTVGTKYWTHSFAACACLEYCTQSSQTFLRQFFRVHEWATFTHEIYPTALFRGKREKEIQPPQKRRNMYMNTANSHTLYGWLNTAHCYTECSNSTLS